MIVSSGVFYQISPIFEVVYMYPDIISITIMAGVPDSFEVLLFLPPSLVDVVPLELSLSPLRNSFFGSFCFDELER